MIILEQQTLFKPAMGYRLVPANRLDNSSLNVTAVTAVAEATA